MSRKASLRNTFRLPNAVRPLRYQLYFRPDFQNFTFTGSETITLVVKRPVRKITLNSLDLEISRGLGWVTCRNRLVWIKDVSYDTKLQTAVLTLADCVPAGKAKLDLFFTGKLNENMCGLYRISYKGTDGKQQVGVSTQFEATDARRAFPCWDEPAQKAIFEVTLDIPEKFIALSNMPAAEETSHLDRKLVTFLPTPPMSTYLLAMVAAELESIEAKDENGVLIRVWTTPGKKEQGRFALDFALKALPLLSSYYGIKYPLPKLDIFACPDFSSGAMENWGLEIFRETAALVDEQLSAVSAKERVADVMAHEFAHHWFGNLVTMYWWTHLWLNEGFANFVENKMVDKIFPAWERTLRFIAEDVIGALHAMDKKNSHPIEVEVRNPEEIREIFDTTTYSGGGAVNMMNEQYLGEKGFQKGLRRYLRRFRFKNARTADLWRELEKATGKPVEKVMGSYTKQAGYPVVLVEEKRVDGELSLELEQKRFLFDGSDDPKSSRWTVPIGVLTPRSQKPHFTFMSGKRMTLEIPDVRPDDWVKLNPGQRALYRTAYPPSMWKRLKKAVSSGELPPADRLGLLDDAFALCRAEYMNMADALDFLSAYWQEKNFFVAGKVAGVLRALDDLGFVSACQEKFRTRALSFFRPLLLDIGWEETPHERNQDIFLRALVIRNLGGYGNQETITEANRRFQAMLDGKPLNPNLRMAIYTLVAENGSGAEFKKFLKIYRSTDHHEEKIRALRALGCFKQPELIKATLAFSVSTEVRAQDTPILIINSGAEVKTALPYTWNFLKDNWDLFKKRYAGGSLGTISRMLGIVKGFSSSEDLRDVSGFFKKHKLPGAERTMAECLEQIKSNIAWRKRCGEEARRWFEKRNVPQKDTRLILTTEALVTEKLHG